MVRSKSSFYVDVNFYVFENTHLSLPQIELLDNSESIDLPNGGHDESFGGDSDDAPPYNFVDDDSERENFFAHDDFQVQELHDIRKIEKVAVPHSAVSKKVDVKRLKNNLWNEND